MTARTRLGGGTEYTARRHAREDGAHDRPSGARRQSFFDGTASEAASRPQGRQSHH